MTNGTSWLKTLCVFSLVAVGIITWVGLPPGASGKIKDGALEGGGEELYPTSEYGWLTYYMHEVYERYVVGKKEFENGDMEMAEANLAVMELFTNLSKEQLPETLQDGKKFDKAGYVASIDKLNSFSAEIRGNLKNKKWADVPAGQLDPMMQTCVGCHQSYNIPTEFRIDTKFKVLTHLMHEIYEIYKQAGPLLQQEKYDQALYCFLVLRGYIEEIPKNIPDVNQDGQPIDKALFEKTYNDLKIFNDGVVKKLRDMNWDKGKPLPPPRIVVDNCYACHTKAAKIPSPW